MIVLGIETATSVCSAALVRDGSVLHVSSVDEPRAHAEILLDQVKTVLEGEGLSLSSVEGIAVSIGPGSFTGLRVGLSVAKGLAWAAGIPMVTVPTLLALAEGTARDVRLSGVRLLAALDARRGEIYCQLFNISGGRIRSQWEARDMTIPQIADELEGSEVTVAGDSKQIQQLGTTMRNLHILPLERSRCSAASVALIGERKFSEGATEDISVVEPHYIKEFMGPGNLREPH